MVFLSGLEFGLLNSLMVIGLAVALRFGNFPDLTVEGALSIGAAVSAIAIASGIPVPICILLGGIVGALAGIVTSSLHLLTRMSRLLAGIIVSTALYAVTLHVLNGSNFPLTGFATWYGDSATWYERVLRSAVVLVPILLLLTTFLRTEYGLLLRASGENWSLVKKLGKPCWLYLLTTLAISNGLVGISGALIANYNGFADVGFGIGTIVTGFASLLIGESILVPTTVGRQLGAAVIGAFVYSTLSAFALRLGLNPQDFKLVSAGFVLAAVVLSKITASEQDNHRIGCDPL